MTALERSKLRMAEIKSRPGGNHDKKTREPYQRDTNFIRRKPNPREVTNDYRAQGGYIPRNYEPYVPSTTEPRKYGEDMGNRFNGEE